MISTEQEARVLRLYHAEKWRIGTIAQQLGLHHSTVQRVVQSGIPEAAKSRWPSQIEPYLTFVQETLQKYPSLSSRRLFEMVKQRGYRGGPDHFRHLVALYRPRPAAEAYLRAADPARGAGTGGLGSLRQVSGAPPDGLRHGAELVAADLSLLLPPGKARKLSARPPGRLHHLGRYAPGPALRQPQEYGA